MSLITAYFNKKEASSVDVLLPEKSHDNTNQVKYPESVQHPVELLLDEDSNLKAPSPPKKMKVALFSSTPSSDCIRNDEEVAVVTTTCVKNPIPTLNDSEQVTVQLPKQQQQSRQTTLKFENGKCILVPMEPSTGMETGSQESSQVDTTTEDDDYQPKRQQRRKRKKSKRKRLTEEASSDNFVEELEPSVAKEPSHKGDKKAAEQLTQHLQGTGITHNSPVNKSTSEGDRAEALPEIIVEDGDSAKEIQTIFENRKNNDVPVVKEGVAVDSSPAAVVKETTADDSSDSDVICLTPRSASPLSQESSSRPATPAKNKWSHIFGTKSPQKRSPSRKSSPCKRNSPRKTSPVKQVTVTPSSLVTSCEHYTLGIPLFYHVMQQDGSVLWDLPKVEQSNINASLTSLSHQSYVTAAKSPYDLCKNDLSKEVVKLDNNIQRKRLDLKVRMLYYCMCYCTV